MPKNLQGVSLRTAEQLSLIQSHDWLQFYAEQPFSDSFLSNEAFRYADALTLYMMIRHARPQRIIEVGSGYSSRVMIETNKRFFGGAVKLTFIEPYAPVEGAMKKKVQDVPLDLFSALEGRDILFIDSSHVSKIGSDVNHIFFEILPRIQPGVIIHFHDIFYPFEYPLEWVRNGRAWNEAYLLRAFLQFNPMFQVELWPNYLMSVDPAWFKANMPLCLEDPGASIWLRRR